MSEITLFTTPDYCSRSDAVHAVKVPGVIDPSTQIVLEEVTTSEDLAKRKKRWRVKQVLPYLPAAHLSAPVRQDTAHFFGRPR